MVEGHLRSVLSLFSILWMTSLPREWRHSAVWHLFLAVTGRKILRFPWKLVHAQSNSQGETWAYWKKCEWRTSFNRKWRGLGVQTVQPIDFRLGMMIEEHLRSVLSLFSIFWMTSHPREWRHSAIMTPFLALTGRKILRFPWKLAHTQSNTQGITWTYWKNVSDVI